MQKPSVYTALSMLLLFKQRRIPLTETEYDMYFDTCLELLEEVNNERFRLDQRKED